MLFPESRILLFRSMLWRADRIAIFSSRPSCGRLPDFTESASRRFVRAMFALRASAFPFGIAAPCLAERFVNDRRALAD